MPLLLPRLYGNRFPPQPVKLQSKSDAASCPLLALRAEGLLFFELAQNSGHKVQNPRQLPKLKTPRFKPHTRPGRFLSATRRRYGRMPFCATGTRRTVTAGALTKTSSPELRASSSQLPAPCPVSMLRGFFPLPYGGSYTPYPGPLPVEGRGDRRSAQSWCLSPLPGGAERVGVR
jgi:hypothetical protein